MLSSHPCGNRKSRTHTFIAATAQTVHFHYCQRAWKRARNRGPHFSQNQPEPLCVSSTASDSESASAARVLRTTRLIVLLVQNAKCPSWNSSCQKRPGSRVRNTMTPHLLFEPSMLAKEASPYGTNWTADKSITPRGYLKVVPENRALRARPSAIV